MNRRLLYNILIVIVVGVSWVHMVLFGGEALAAGGFENLKYFTLQSNLLAGLAALLWIVCFAKNADEKTMHAVEILKYAAAVSVGLTFITVMGFLGNLYGYAMMLSGANLGFHLIVPLLALWEICALCDTKFTGRDNLIAVVPMILYGIGYMLNCIINGIGEWPDMHDWYGFLQWGYPVGAAIFAFLILLSWLIGLAIRKIIARRLRKG